MKLKYTMEPVSMGSEIIAVPVGPGSLQLSGVLRLNQEGSEILSLLTEDTTEDAIVQSLSTKYENSQDELAAMVGRFLQILRENGLLDE